MELNGERHWREPVDFYSSGHTVQIMKSDKKGGSGCQLHEVTPAKVGMTSRDATGRVLGGLVGFFPIMDGLSPCLLPLTLALKSR